MVRYVQRTCGNSSTHFPFVLPSLFLCPLTMTLLIVSACPFPYGYGGVEYLFIAISPKGLAIELKTVVRDEGMRDFKLSDNIFPNKSLGIHIPDICQWFSFNPFNEVIRADQQIPLISYCLREKTYNVQAPLSKRPRVGQRVKDSSWLMNVWCKSLALVTLLHMLLCFPLHIWPPIALGKGPVRQRFASCVAPTNSLM